MGRIRPRFALATLALLAIAHCRPGLAEPSKEPPLDAQMLLDLDLLKDSDLANEHELLRRMPVLERLRLLESLRVLDSQPPAPPGPGEAR